MTDSILIIGGGIAGLHAAMECANAGSRAIVVERGPVIGGKLAATMTDAAAIGDRAEGTSTPLFDALAGNSNIEIITLAMLENIDGRPGNFTVSIHEKARFVTDACTRCKLCRAACPVVVPNESDAGLMYRKAIYTPMSETMPPEYLIDIQNCLNTPPNYLPCNRCIDVCADNAIFFDLPLDTVHQRQVGAVIVAAGFQYEHSDAYRELGYGKHPDIVTSAELQRMLESPGPTGGFASKPSNEEYPGSVLLVLDDPSPFSLYIVASQVHQLLQQDVETVAVLVLSQLTQESDAADVQALAGKTGVQVRWGAMLRVEPTDDNTLAVSYENYGDNRYAQEVYDMVVLSTDVEPAKGLEDLAQTVGVDMAESGYIAVEAANGAQVNTSQPGIFVAGCASGPKNIVNSITDAQAAAKAAIDTLDPRLLHTEHATVQKTKLPDSVPELSADDARASIEQLLYALINRPDA